MYNVMIIEDEEVLRYGLSSIIDWHQHDCVVVYAAENGKDAFDQLERYKPDIVILDINMPIMNGLEFLEKTQHHYTFRSIIISGYDDFEYAQKAISYDVVAYLMKPLEEKQLIEAIEIAKRKIMRDHKEQHNGNDSLRLLQKYMNGDITNNDTELKVIINYIETNYQEKISIEDLMPILNRGKTYLNKKFREETEMSFNEYVNHYRIIQAIRLIRETNDTIASIADTVGFNNYKNFVEIFKKYTNVLPKDFLKYQQFPNIKDEYHKDKDLGAQDVLKEK